MYNCKQNIWNDVKNMILDGLASLGVIASVGDTKFGLYTSAPTGWLFCDGSTYNKEDYPRLAAHLATLHTASEYVVNGDNTKFKVPDFRGDFLRCTGGAGTTVGVRQAATGIPYILPHNTSIYLSKSDFLNVDGSAGSAVMHEFYQSKNTGSSQPQVKYVRPVNRSLYLCIKY